MASTTALPPPTCTAWREAGQHLRLLFCCGAGQLLAVVSSRPVPVGLSAGSVRLQRPSSAGCACLPATFALPCPLPFSSVCPRSLCFAPTCLFPCAPGSSQATVCKLQGLPCWQLQHGPAVAVRAPVLTFTFFLQSPLILGHGLV